MKKIVYFLLGLLSGVVLTLVVLYIIGRTASSSEFDEPNVAQVQNPYGPTFFEQPGETFDFRSVKVFQVLEAGVALGMAEEKGKYTNTSYYTGITVLLYDKQTHFYDEQIVKLSDNKVFKQVGIYRYPNTEENILTVPIVSIFE